ncbi:MAG: cation transporter [Dysgonamonadaceae bacterium]|jgi:Cu(I)/Ag(I) efflux system membrane fusion protein|nr:cation transporter [Dysgonamonadaceae bacterium]
MKQIFYLFIAAAFIFSTACSGQKSNPESQAAVAQTDVSKASLEVEGKCGMCKTKIEKAALAINGVDSADWNAETKQLDLTFDKSKTSVGAVSKAIAAIGYDTELDKAPEDVYAALPGCCKYRETAE